MACLPLRVARAAGTVIGVTAWRLQTRAARMTSFNVDTCFPHLTFEQRRALSRRSLIETGRLVAETGFAWYGTRRAFERRVRIVEGAELISRPATEGLLILMPHLGNWEILAYIFGGSNVACLYTPPRVPGLEKGMIHGRGRWGIRAVPADVGGLRTLKRTLDIGGAVGILPDQTPSPDAGVRAPFFGHDAITMTLAHRLLTERTRAIVATAQRTGSGFDVRIALADDGIRDPDPVASATAMNAAIETEVLRDPAQYQWEYNRFRHTLH